VLVFKRLVHWFEKFEQGLRERMLAEIPQEFGHMYRCLDLRALARAALPDDDAERGALAELGKWIREKGQLKASSSCLITMSSGLNTSSCARAS
jgi:hypothetical protein